MNARKSSVTLLFSFNIDLPPMILVIIRPWLFLHAEMEAKEEKSSTFNINLLTGHVTVPSSSDAHFLVQGPPSSMLESSKMLPPPTPDVPSSSKHVATKAKPAGKVRVKEVLEKDSEEYIRRRQRNNVAVKKSREKTREKSAYTLQKVEQLKVENEQLESKIATLTKELSVLKDLFMDHARGFCTGGSVSLPTPEQLEALLGCKVIRSETNNSPAAGTSIVRSPQPVRALSTIEPLINAAEIGLMSFKDGSSSTVSIQTTQHTAESSSVLQYTKPESNPSFKNKSS